jgi:hypothetical protein
MLACALFESLFAFLPFLKVTGHAMNLAFGQSRWQWDECRMSYSIRSSSRGLTFSRGTLTILRLFA